MYKAKYLILSESSSIDQATNIASFFGIIEELSSPKFPIIVPKLSINSSFSKDQSDANSVDLTFQILNNEKVLIAQTFPLKFLDKNTAKLSITIGGIPVGEPGELTVKLNVAGNETLVSIPVTSNTGTITHN